MKLPAGNEPRILFDLERSSIEQMLNFERALMGMFALGAAIGTFAPVAIPQCDKATKTFSLFYGLGSSIAFTISANLRQRKEKIYGAIDQAQLTAFKNSMAHAIAYEDSVSRVAALRRMANFVAQLPSWEQSRWVTQFGLQGLLEPPMRVVIEEQPRRAIVEVQSSQVGLTQLEEELTPAIDYRWLDAQFICASKGVFGARGSGKSTYLSFEAFHFLQLHPAGELRIGDLHFDEEESSWLPGIPAEILLERYVATKPAGILALFRKARRLLRERVDQGERKGQPFKFICDEFVGFMSRLSDNERVEVVETIQENSFEGRKYGVSLVLGLHSLKKQMTGIDSSALLSGMDLLFLGRSLSDPATKFPSDIDAKLLLTEQEMLQAILSEKDGRACVVRKLGEAPAVVALPYIDLSSLTIQLDSEDWYEEIQKWINQLGRNPTPDELRVKWETLTGQQLNDEGVKLLLEHLLAGRQDTET